MTGIPSSTWHRGRRQALIAGALHLAGYVALAYGREPIAQWFYQWAWWTFIVAADGLVLAKRGASLLHTRPNEAALLALWSIVFWFHFETWNLRLQDWYYIGADPSLVVRTVRYTTAFATVLPGVFEIFDLLEAYEFPRRVAIRPRAVGAGTWRLSYALGIAMAVLPVLWPTYAFPLVWGVFVFLLDPINAKWGGHSFWQDWSRGDLTVLCRTLCAGFIAGGLWETWNFWAPVKWLYTVPFFENFKIFEMPVFGFLGFPPFAVELMCMTTFVTLLRNGRGWRATPATPTRGPILSRRAWGRVTVLCVLYVLVQMALTNRFTIGARRARLADSVWGMTPAGQALVAAGFTYPDEVARALNHPGERLRIGAALAWPPEDIEVAAGPILLAALPPLDASDAYLLTTLDIFTVDRLARADPVRIASGPPTYPLPSGETRRSPSVRRARLWVQAAQREIARWPPWRSAGFSRAAGSGMMPAADAE